MLLNLQMSREIGISVFVAFVLAAFVAYRLLTRRIRRRRIVALELRLEAAWEHFKVSWGIPGSHKNVGLTSTLVGGLQTGPQGRVLSIRPLSASAARKPEPTRVPLASAAVAVAQPAPSAAAPSIETVQQTQISCDI
ncbi:MAG: hypothetical protein ABSB35_02585 [Bryobacteraceae bacterium]|jgi:hypothetical protein